MCSTTLLAYFFFFNRPATTELYTLSLHDALPIWAQVGDPVGGPRRRQQRLPPAPLGGGLQELGERGVPDPDRKSTRLNSSHTVISYAVFCLKKKKQTSVNQKKSSERARQYK